MSAPAAAPDTAALAGCEALLRPEGMHREIELGEIGRASCRERV